jgi:hypothetical protein
MTVRRVKDNRVMRVRSLSCTISTCRQIIPARQHAAYLPTPPRTAGHRIRNVNLKWPRRDGSSWPRGQPGWGASGCSDSLRGPIRSAGARVLPIAAADRRRSRCASRVSGPGRCLGGRDERGRRRRDGAGHVAGHRLPKLAASARRLLNWIPGSVCRGDGRVGDGGRRG